MLSPSTRFCGLPCNVPRFWRLRVAKDFTKPDYYIGQTVIYQEFFVDVTGIAWTSDQWQYLIEPSVYPQRLKAEERGWEEWVHSRELNPPLLH